MNLMIAYISQAALLIGNDGKGDNDKQIIMILTLTVIVVVISVPIRPIVGIWMNIKDVLGVNKMLANEVGQALSRLNSSNNSIKVDLLYDENNDDTAVLLSKTLVSSTSGLMTLAYDSPEKILSQVLKTDSGTTVLLALCSPAIILEIFSTIRKKSLESHVVKWLLILKADKDPKAFVKGLEGMVFEGTKVAIITEQQKGSPKVYSSFVDTKGITRFSNTGYWVEKTEDNMVHLRHLLTSDDDVPLNMKGRVLRVAALERMPHFAVGQLNPDGSREATGGFDLMILKTLASSFNFSFKVFEPEDGSFGNPRSDGTVSGMIGMVARREASMAFGGITLTDVRDTVVDFSDPYHFAYMGIFSRAPKEKSRALAVLSPFTFEVWICLIFATLIIGPVLFAISWITLRDEESWSFQSLQKYSFQMFRNLVNQGNEIKPKYWSQKILLMSWFLFCLINAALYSGTLTAVLAIPAFEKPIDSLGDLPKAVKDGFTLCVNRDTTNEYIFRDAESGIYKSTWALFNHKDRSESFVSGLSEGVSRFIYGPLLHCSKDEKGGKPDYIPKNLPPYPS
ncbi:glutamate receptor ionotropic, delta-2-like [Palaemon carinicauda]|uniref:glutamate receptor ionotropic, delta-2-like n=1 Tax=Palaemon carinicauda TaxID=392227 RepID=UPI0035B6024D